MAKYRISFKKAVTKDLRAIPNQDIVRILSRIDTLAINPRGEGCIKLSGQECYRARQGIYRIVYQVFDDRLVVNVVKVAHRSRIYRDN